MEKSWTHRHQGVNASSRHSKRMLNSKCEWYSWSPPTDLVKQCPSVSTVAAQQDSSQASSNLEIQGRHWIITQGENSSLTINMNRKSFRSSPRIHLLEFDYLETTSRWWDPWFFSCQTIFNTKLYFGPVINQNTCTYLNQAFFGRVQPTEQMTSGKHSV